MKKEHLISGVAGVIIGIVLTFLFTASPVGVRQIGMMGQNIDRHFIEEMIPHHDGAIAMAELALERSKRVEILDLSREIIEAQKKENQQMRAWYADWFGGEPSGYSNMGGRMGHGGMGMQMMGMEGDLDKLKSAPDFDLEFIAQMIPHHEMAIMMARMLSASTERPEMKKLADDITSSQSKEIEMMKGWYEVWSK